MSNIEHKADSTSALIRPGGVDTNARADARLEGALVHVHTRALVRAELVALVARALIRALGVDTPVIAHAQSLALVLVHARVERARLEPEALLALAAKRAGRVAAVRVRGADLAEGALVHVLADISGLVECVAGGADAFEAARRVHTCG